MFFFLPQDYYLTINTTSPDLTPCFESTVLVWVPCGFMWLFSVPHLVMLKNSRKPPLNHSWLSISKTVSKIYCFSTAFLNGIATELKLLL